MNINNFFENNEKLIQRTAKKLKTDTVFLLKNITATIQHCIAIEKLTKEEALNHAFVVTAHSWHGKVDITEAEKEEAILDMISRIKDYSEKNNTEFSLEVERLAGEIHVKIVH